MGLEVRVSGFRSCRIQVSCEGLRFRVLEDQGFRRQQEQLAKSQHFLHYEPAGYADRSQKGQKPGQ